MEKFKKPKSFVARFFTKCAIPIEPIIDANNHLVQILFDAFKEMHRRQFLLSGLLVCGSCRGGYTIVGRDRYGCAAHRSRGTCSNGFLVGRHELEDRVLIGLKERLMTPDFVAGFIDAFNTEMRNLAAAAEQESLALKRRLAEIDPHCPDARR